MTSQPKNTKNNRARKLVFLRWITANPMAELNDICAYCEERLDYALPEHDDSEPILSPTADSFSHAKCARVYSSTKWVKKHGIKKKKSRS